MKEPKIGKILKNIRTSRKLSQLEAAQKIGVGRTTWNKFENDAQPVPSDLVPTICKEFAVTPNFLFGFESNDNLHISLDGLRLSDQKLVRDLFTRLNVSN